MRDNTILKVISLFLFAFLLILPVMFFAQSTGSPSADVLLDAKDGSPLSEQPLKLKVQIWVQ